MSITNKKNQLLITKSFGQAKYSRAAEKVPRNSYVYAYLLGRYLRRKKKIVYINITFKGWSPYLRQAIKGLRGSGMHFLTILNNTPIPYNGCRFKKKKR